MLTMFHAAHNLCDFSYANAGGVTHADMEK